MKELLPVWIVYVIVHYINLLFTIKVFAQLQEWVFWLKKGEKKKLTEHETLTKEPMVTQIDTLRHYIDGPRQLSLLSCGELPRSAMHESTEAIRLHMWWHSNCETREQCFGIFPTSTITPSKTAQLARQWPLLTKHSEPFFARANRDSSPAKNSSFTPRPSDPSTIGY